MARGKKAGQKNTAPAPETPERVENTTPAPETPEREEDPAPAPETPEREEDPAPVPETPEREEDPAPAPETPEREEDPAPVPETPEREEDPAPTQEAPERDVLAGIQNPCVYCGPTVRGVARQYTTFQGGIPDALRDFIEDHPEARGLIVSTAQFPAMRRRLDTTGTAEAKLYKRVKEQIGK